MAHDRGNISGDIYRCQAMRVSPSMATSRHLEGGTRFGIETYEFGIVSILQCRVFSLRTWATKGHFARYPILFQVAVLGEGEETVLPGSRIYYE